MTYENISVSRVGVLLVILVAAGSLKSADQQGIGKLTEQFSWKQIYYNIEGREVLTDRFGSSEDLETPGNSTSSSDNKIVFSDASRVKRDGIFVFPHEEKERPSWGDTVPDTRKFFIRYNNVPMGVERWRNKLFITMPRRRHGIPSTLNYIDLDVDGMSKSPGLRPYPRLMRNPTVQRANVRPGSVGDSVPLVSVYRTRVDSCNRLWMVDTGMLEIPNNRQQIQNPAIVVYDLQTDKQIHRYELKESDLINNGTPAGLASITVDVINKECRNTYAYIPDLATYGIIVYSMKLADSWRINHNYFSFNPIAGNLHIAGENFSWNDGVFSITLGDQSEPRGDSTYKWAYFHPMVSYQEFRVSTKVFRNRTLATRNYHGDDFVLLGNRGDSSQSTMHAYDRHTGVILWAQVGSDSITCWNTANTNIEPGNLGLLARDNRRLIYPSDLHVNEDGEVWIMSNKMPTFIYSTLNEDEINFRIFRGKVKEMIQDTVCEQH